MLDFQTGIMAGFLMYLGFKYAKVLSLFWKQIWNKRYVRRVYNLKPEFFCIFEQYSFYASFWKEFEK